jgi:transaldolase
MNAIHRLRELGQSVWLDFVNHELVESGELRRMIEHDGISGLTSNPTIFEKSIARSKDYDDLIEGAAPDETVARIFERICVRDIQLACDAFRATYEATAGADGFASIEVSPLAAHDTEESITQTRRLWTSVARPNVMVKIPGTREGLRAIEQCLAAGINVNITLLFSVERYEEVANAYLHALEHRRSAGMPIDRVASVASFFVSRVDVKIDPKVPPELRGRAAIANAKIAFEAHDRIFSGPRWQSLAALGARPQRVLWASTSPKDPAYPDVFYAEALAGPDSVDTMTKETVRAYLDHGRPELRLTKNVADAHTLLAQLGMRGVDFAKALAELEDEGVQAFAKSYAEALATIAKKRNAKARAEFRV